MTSHPWLGILTLRQLRKTRKVQRHDEKDRTGLLHVQKYLPQEYFVED